MSDITKGDTVKLIGIDGPKMLVVGVIPYVNGSKCALCVWFTKGRVRQKEFSTSLLQKV